MRRRYVQKLLSTIVWKGVILIFNSIQQAYDDYCRVHSANYTPNDSIYTFRRLVAALRMEFPATLEGYRTLIDELLGIWQRSVGHCDPVNSEDFRTSGTTRGVSRLYRFGPNPQLWISALWQMMRFPFEWRGTVKLDIGWNPEVPTAVTSPPHGLYQYVVCGGMLNSDRLAEAITILEQFLARYPTYTLLAVPDVFLYLNEQPNFQHFVIENSACVNLSSWNWEPFYKKKQLSDQGVHVSDAMIDWATGLNFYTCRAGKQHVYPIFAKRDDRTINLLNLMQPPDQWGGGTEDLLEPLGVTDCACGAKRLEYRFVPHQSTSMRAFDGRQIYDVSLAERLSSTFQCLQFIQRGPVVAIYYVVEGEMRDRCMLEDYFNKVGFSVDWRPNEVFTTCGPKRIVFFSPGDDHDRLRIP